MRFFIILLLFTQISVSAKLVSGDSKINQSDPIQDEIEVGRPTEKRLSINWRPVYWDLDPYYNPHIILRKRLSVNWRPLLWDKDKIWTPKYQDKENNSFSDIFVALKTEVLKMCAGQESHYQDECSSDIADKIIVALIEDCVRNNNKAFCSSKYGSDESSKKVLKVIKEGIQLSHSDPWHIFAPLYNHSSEEHGHFEKLAIIPFDPNDPNDPNDPFPFPVPNPFPYLSQLLGPGPIIVVVHKDSSEMAPPPMRYSALPAGPIPYEHPPIPEPGPDDTGDTWRGPEPEPGPDDWRRPRRNVPP